LGNDLCRDAARDAARDVLVSVLRYSGSKKEGDGRARSGGNDGTGNNSTARVRADTGGEWPLWRDWTRGAQVARCAVPRPAWADLVPVDRAGIRTVPISKIRGSEGRSEDFDREFHPLRLHNQGRWLSVATARQRGVVLPPVELIQIGDIYFVRDGHHRISVAKAFGQEEIEAEVTVWETDCLPNAYKPATSRGLTCQAA
jgi:hypothetical protein